MAMRSQRLFRVASSSMTVTPSSFPGARADVTCGARHIRIHRHNRGLTRTSTIVSSETGTIAARPPGSAGGLHPIGEKIQ
ncbi:MAG: hypothetical protein ABIT83_03710 [Massilia sp.]